MINATGNASPANGRLHPDLRLALNIALGLFAFGMVIGWLKLGPSPFAQFIGFLQAPSLPLALGPFAVFFATLFFCAIDHKAAVAVVLAAGIAGGSAHLFVNGAPELSGIIALYYLLTFGLWLGGASLVALGWLIWRGDTPRQREVARDALLGCAFVFLWGLFLFTYLRATAFLHPATYDAILYRFEETQGVQFAPLIARWVAAVPGLGMSLDLVYEYLAFGFAAVYGWSLRKRTPLPLNLMLLWALGGLCGFIAYHLLPAAGPRYLLGSLFPTSPMPASIMPATVYVVAPVPRNAMPSLHFGWIIMLWAYAHLQGTRWITRACLLMLTLTLAATLAKGEHYLIDLAVAMPFFAAVLAAGLRSVPWSETRKSRIVLAGFGVWLAWIFALRFGLAAFEAVPGLAWAAIIATIVHATYLYREFFALARAASALGGELSSPPRTSGVCNGLTAATVMFFISGMTALVYEVVFSKSLALIFGSTAIAAYTVLATYMGGMAIGAWIGGRIGALTRRPLLLYATCEALIGIYCLATPLIFDGIRAAYIALAAGSAPDAPLLTVLRIALGAGALAVPTVLMGMTLPALARYFENAAQSMGRSVATLYGANTFGAALGALLAGYFVLPSLGMSRSIMATALCSVAVGLYAVKLHRDTAGDAPVVTATPDTGTGAIAANPHRGRFALALVLLVATGFITLALEVLYMQLLSVVAGNSVYAFALMLFAFLAGIAGGAAAARALMRLAVPPLAVIGWLQCALAAVILFGVLGWDDIPRHFAAYAGYPLGLDFTQREAIRAVSCLAAMLPPAFLIGALYPLTMALATQASNSPQIRVLGLAASLNTIGNIAGVLAAGFVLLPVLGSMHSVRVLAVLALLLGFACLWPVRRAMSAYIWSPVALVLLAVIVQPRTFDYNALVSGANVYFRAQDWGQVEEHFESVDGGLTAVTRRSVSGQDVLTLLTNGKFQGNDAAGGEMKAQAGFALAPLLHTSRRDRALVIGYGTGGSAHTLHAAGFAQLDIVELSADVLRLADRYFPYVNYNVTRKPGVRTFVTDGRNFLMLQPAAYDLISMEISSIWFAGAANLYNREFYQLAKSRLVSGGVLQQWVQLHHMRPIDLLFVLGSVRAEFEFVWVYLLGDQGIIVASNDPAARPDAANSALLEHAQGLKDIVALYDGNLQEVAASVLLSPRGLDLFLSSFDRPRDAWISTDDNLVLEYGTPRGNVLRGPESLAQSVAMLRKFEAGATGTAGGILRK